MDLIKNELGRLSLQLLKKLALPSLRHLLQIFLLSLAVADLLTALLKSVNFIYWKYFRSFRYILALVGVLLHYNIKIHFGDIPWVNALIFYYSASAVGIYLVDFAWKVGKDMCDQQPLANKVMLVGLVGGLVGMVVANTVYVKYETVYVGYLVAVVGVGLLARQGRLAVGVLVVGFAHMQRMAVEMWQEHWMVSVVIMAVLLAIAYDRQGK